MFIRVKTINGQKYGYIVENKWAKGTSRQKVAKYIGKITDEGLTRPATTNNEKIREAVQELIEAHLKEKGYEKDKETLTKDKIKIHIATRTVKNKGKNAVIKINNGYLCKETIEKAEKQPENIKEMAENLTNAGINMTPEEFARIAQKIMPEKEQGKKEKIFEEFYY
ncbi:hypothetical protein HY483_01105 [Candidatus Woesearchaeota archaeon]|nr:hypothetical protein [Candidatus Woesearchaeota archaeon]